MKLFLRVYYQISEFIVSFINYIRLLQFLPIKLVNGDEIFRESDRHNVETVTRNQCKKWIIEFFSKIQGGDIKIA